MWCAEIYLFIACNITCNIYLCTETSLLICAHQNTVNPQTRQLYIQNAAISLTTNYGEENLYTPTQQHWHVFATRVQTLADF